MAEIAKEDINKRLEKNAEKFASIFPDVVEYSDEYYKSTPVKTKASENDQRLGVELVKPKRKYTKKPKK
jgi:hypothetical protein